MSGRIDMAERIAAYLDGELDDGAAAQVEAALIDPAVAELLGEELLMRDLLGCMPPNAAPEDLIARIEDSLGVGDGWLDAVGERVRAAWTRSGRALSVPSVGTTALAAAQAGVNGTRMVVSGATAVRQAGVSGTRLASSGASAVRRSAHLVAELPLPGRPPKPKSLWRRVAGSLLRRRK